jgi:imidazolonepropionase-like amidohydrolase
MLMHVADTFGFKVNTFTHILEGYKVADKMKKHGVAASTFSDWWGYKYEVADAIPYNAGIMNKVGVLTGINSDDPEMGRRLNQEAAKTIKYSDVSEIEALNMVTINPAKMLHIDNRVGSITIGKDADLVLWDGNPLSNYSKPVTTWEKFILTGMKI